MVAEMLHLSISGISDCLRSFNVNRAIDGKQLPLTQADMKWLPVKALLEVAVPRKLFIWACGLLICSNTACLSTGSSEVVRSFDERGPCVNTEDHFTNRYTKLYRKRSKRKWKLPYYTGVYIHALYRDGRGIMQRTWKLLYFKGVYIYI